MSTISQFTSLILVQIGAGATIDRISSFRSQEISVPVMDAKKETLKINEKRLHFIQSDYLQQLFI